MFQRREISWIGFQEAQKSISSLKQEVEVAEKKLLGFKKSFYKRSKGKKFEIDFSSTESLETFKSKDVQKSPHSNQTAVSSLQKISSDVNKNTSGIPKTFITSDEEPNFLPTKCDLVEPLEFKREYKYSVNNFILSSSDVSFSSTSIKYSSSDETSSLIACTYGDGEKLPKKNETKVKEPLTDEIESISSVYGQVDAHKDEKIGSNKKSHCVVSKDDGIEWKEAPVTRASLLQKVLKPDNFQTLKDIIDRQKRRHEEYQFQIEKKVSSSSKHPDSRNFKSEKDLYHPELAEDNEVTSVPVRKVCVVKSFPFYKGFSAPSTKNLIALRQRKQKNKHTVAKQVTIKSSPKVTKRIKTVVKHKSASISASQSKSIDKVKNGVDKDRKPNEDDPMDEVNTESLKEISNEKTNEGNQDLNAEQHKENDLKIDIHSILHEYQSLSKENSVENEGSIKNETFSYNVETKSISSKLDIDQNSTKENTKPKKSKSIKRKSKKSPEQKVISPKVKPYDVGEVRDYIKKKKKERLKRHQEEVRKQVLEAQKKKESLEKLLEYQRQIKKNTTEGKPLSPIKVHHNKESVRREHENKPENFIHENCNTDSVLVDEIKRKEIKDLPLTSVDSSAVLQNKEVSTERTLIENQIHSSNSEREEIIQKDISVPKLISVSVTPLLAKPTTGQANNVNDSSKVISHRESPVKKKKKVSKPEHPSKTSIDLLPDEEIFKENKTVVTGENDNMGGFSFEILNALDNISGMNTLSEISDVGYINVNMMKESKTTKDTLTGCKLNNGEVLKDLMKSINEMTKPLEPFLRTKQWLDKNPRPPKSRKTRTVVKVDFPKQIHRCNENFDFHSTHSQTDFPYEGSFKEHVSRIGDVTQLYAQILGRKSTNVSKPSHESIPAVPPEIHDDEIIEASISDEEYILDENQTKFENNHSQETSSCSSHFSDLQRASVTPNPFNFINTFKRKPLGLREFTTSTPVEIMNSKIPKNYDVTENSNSNVKPSTEANTFKSCPIENTQSASFIQGNEHSPLVKESANHLASQTFSQSDVLFKASEVASLSDHSFEDGSEDLSSKHTVISQVMPEQTILNKDTVSTKESHASVIYRENINEKGTIESQSNKLPTSSDRDKLSSVAKKTVSKHSPKSVPDIPTTGMSDLILSGTITSEYTIRMEEDIQENFKDVHSEGLNDAILSGTINTDYTLDLETEESIKEERQKSKSDKTDDIEQKKISVSESSISEDIVENLEESSKSAEEQNKVSASSKKSELYSHIKASNTISSNHQPSSGSSEKRSNSKKLNASDAQDKRNISTISSVDPKHIHEHSALLLKKDNISSIPHASQNSLTIDYRQPLRLTVSNGESVHSSQRLDLHNDQYLHTQVITKVASEVAAAAASSAVMAIFETQKVLFAEQNFSRLKNSFEKSSSSKKTQYSSDFESSQAAKSSSQSPLSNINGNKDSDSVFDDDVIHNESSSKDESIEEKIPSKTSSQDQLEDFRSSHISSKKSNENVVSTLSEEIMDENLKMPERSKRKTSGNISSPSPASLSDKESGSSETLRSSSHVSNLNDSELSDDSFHQLSLNVVRNMMHEDEVRARHQLFLLQIQEKNLVEKARTDMIMLESLKQKLREKGLETKDIKRKQKNLINRLREERIQLQKMQETYRNICEKYCSSSEEKKKLPKETSSAAFQSLTQDEETSTTRHSEFKMKDIQKLKTLSSTSTILSDYDEKIILDEESISEVPEVFKSPDSNSSHVQSNSNLSLHSNNSVDSAVQGLKKLEASKRHLTKREQRILQRRKQVECLLQFKKKLDKEEKAVRELEQKALNIVDQSKTRAKYYVSSSGSTNQEENRKEKSLESSVKASNHLPKQSEDLSKQYSDEMDHKTSKTTFDKNIPTNLSENDVEELFESEKGIQTNSNSHSNSSSPQDTRHESGGQSIQTVESAENSSQPEEVVSEEISNHASPITKDKSSSSEIYSESFESSVSKRSSSAISISSPIKDADSTRVLKKSARLGIRPPLVPRNMRRHDSSGSDDSYTISHSETASDQSDIEVRIHALAEELKRRKAEAEKLKREQKKKNREQLKEKELSLQKQLEAYNQYIQQTKLELEHQLESAVSPPQANDIVIKPQIKWPRPDQVIESRRVRKQTILTPDTFTLEKKSDFMNSMPETTGKSEACSDKEKVVKTLFSESSSKTNEKSTKQAILGKLPSSSSEVSEALSASISSEIQDISEIEQSNSSSSKILSEVKEISQSNESSTNTSVILHKTDETKSLDSEIKESSLVLSSFENKSSRDDITQSNSQTDTFLSESSSSKNSEYHSPQHNDEILSNSTVTVEEETVRTDKEVSEDDVHKLDSLPSHEISDESSTSEISVSDAQSVINSGSMVEELDKECLSKNSKCSSPNGCESFSKNELINSKNNFGEVSPVEKNKDISSDLSCSIDVSTTDEENKFPSESKIVNIVTFISSSLTEDAFHTLFRILKEKNDLRNYLNQSPFTDKVETKSLSFKEKAAEALTRSLFDIHMHDTFACVFKIISRLKNKSQKSLFLINSIDSTSTEPNFTKSILNQSSLTAANDPIKVAIDNASARNDADSFAKSAEWTSESQNALEKNQQYKQLEQQLILQQYSYFYRKIPNKPPPPYTPPSSEFPFVKEKPIEKVTSVKEVVKNVDKIMSHTVEVLLAEKQNGLSISDVSLNAENFITDELGLTMPNQSIFAYYIIDLTKEVIQEKFSETKHTHKPWLRPHKLTPKPVIPTTKDVIIKGINKEVKQKLKIDGDTLNAQRRSFFSWSSLKLGRKKRDFVDTILIRELKEEEPDWVNYDQDEMAVKLQIADSIFNLLICDTINVIKEIQKKVDL